MSEEKISDGKKAIEAEVKKLAAEAGLTSISYAWVENGTYYEMTASFGDYYFKWSFSKAQLEKVASGYIGFYIKRTLKHKISSLCT